MGRLGVGLVVNALTGKIGKRRLAAHEGGAGHGGGLGGPGSSESSTKGRHGAEESGRHGAAGYCVQSERWIVNCKLQKSGAGLSDVDTF